MPFVAFRLCSRQHHRLCNGRRSPSGGLSRLWDSLPSGTGTWGPAAFVWVVTQWKRADGTTSCRPVGWTRGYVSVITRVSFPRVLEFVLPCKTPPKSTAHSQGSGTGGSSPCQAPWGHTGQGSPQGGGQAGRERPLVRAGGHGTGQPPVLPSTCGQASWNPGGTQQRLPPRGDP